MFGVYELPVPNKVLFVASYQRISVPVAVNAGTISFTEIDLSPPEIGVEGVVTVTSV